MVRVTGQIELDLQANPQVCLDGHSPSFAPANRQTLPATKAHGVGQVLHSRNQNEKYGDELKSVSIFLVRVTGLEPARINTRS